MRKFLGVSRFLRSVHCAVMGIGRGTIMRFTKKEEQYLFEVLYSFMKDHKRRRYTDEETALLGSLLTKLDPQPEKHRVDGSQCLKCMAFLWSDGGYAGDTREYDDRYYKPCKPATDKARRQYLRYCMKLQNRKKWTV